MIGIRKAIAVLCCFSLVLTSPGASALFAQNSVVDKGYSAFPTRHGIVSVHNGYKMEKDSSRRSLKFAELRDAVRGLHLPQEMENKALLMLERSDSRFVTPEAEAAARKFLEESRKPDANKGLLLMELFDGWENAVAESEEAGNRERTVVDEGKIRVTQVWNTKQQREVQQVRSEQIDEDVQRILIYKPDPEYNPKNPTKEHPKPRYLDAVAFAYTKDGQPVQKVVWSRRLKQVAQILNKAFYEKPEVEAQIKELRDQSKDADHWFWKYALKIYDHHDQLKKKKDADSLQAELDQSRDKFKEAKINQIIDGLDKIQKPETIRPGDLTPEAIERMSHRLEDWQYGLQKFYAQNQLENLQKMVLAFLVQYFSQALGLNYDPFDQKKGSKEGFGITNMDIEVVQKLLDDFEKGSYNGYGLVGDRMHFWYRRVDPDKDLPKKIKDVVNEAIRYMGYAVEARRRMDLADDPRSPRREERAAALEEMNRWITPAQVQLQAFELYMSAGDLKRLKDGTNMQEIRLRSGSNENDSAEAERLIKMAQEQFLPQFEKLEKRTQNVQLQQMISAFTLDLQNARYTHSSVDSLKEKLAVLLMNAKEMQAVYLAMRFREYIKDPAIFGEFRRRYLADFARKNPKKPDLMAAYYRTQSEETGLYAYFLDNKDNETQRGFDAFDRVISLLEHARKSDAAATRQALIPVEGALGPIYALLHCKSAPSPQSVERAAAQLGVFQSSLGAAVGQFQQDLQLFTAINQLDLSMMKSNTSSNAPEIQSRSWIRRIFSGDILNHWLNWFGARDALGDLTGYAGSWIYSSDAWKVLGSKDAKATREDIRKMMREGDYEGALDKLISLDPKARDKAEGSYQLAQMKNFEDKSLDIDNILSQGSDNKKQALSQGVLNNARKMLGEYSFWHMIGSGIWDFVAVSAGGSLPAKLLSTGIGWLGDAMLLGSKIVQGFEKAEGLASLKKMGDALRLVARLMEIGTEGSGNILKGISQNINRMWKLPGWREYGNGKAYWASVKQITRSNLRLANQVGWASTMIQLAYYVYSPQTSPYQSAGDVFKYGWVGGATWAAKSGILFAFAPPADSIHAGGHFARAYKFLAQEDAFSGTARLTTKVFKLSSPFARDILEAEQGGGLWAAAQKRMLRIAVPGSEYLTNMAQFTANTALKGLQHVAGYAKFAIFSELMSETVQAAAYGHYHRKFEAEEKRLMAEGKTPDEFAPSAHLRALVGAHQASQTMLNAAYIFIPSSGFYSPEDMVKSKEAQGAIKVVLKEGGPRLNEILTKSPNETVKVEITGWQMARHSRWARVLANGARKIVGKEPLGPKVVDLPTTEETNKHIAKETLRTLLNEGKISIDQVRAIGMMPVKKAGVNGEKDQFYQQEFHKWEHLDIETVAKGEEINKPIDWHHGEPEKKSTMPIPDIKDAIYVDRTTMDAANEIFREYLLDHPEEAKKIATVVVDQPGAGLMLGRKTITDADTIKKIHEGFSEIFTNGNSKDWQTVAKTMMGILREKEKRGMKDSRPEWFNDRDWFRKMVGLDENMDWVSKTEWDELAAKMAKRGEQGKNIASAMENENVRKVLLTRVLLKYIGDYANRVRGTLPKTSATGELTVAEVRDAIVKATWDIMQFKGMLNPRDPEHPISEFKEIPDKSGNSPQKVLLEEFWGSILEGNSEKDALGAVGRAMRKIFGDDPVKIFGFLMASGGKTFLEKVAFIPYLEARADSLTWFQKFYKDPRRVWMTTANDHLGRQFGGDWAALSGGLAPDFKVTGISKAMFEEIFRMERGQRSIGWDFVFMMDEMDKTAGDPQVSVGVHNGDWSDANPAVGVGLKYLKIIKEELSAMQERVGRDAGRIMESMGLTKEEIERVQKDGLTDEMRDFLKSKGVSDQGIKEIRISREEVLLDFLKNRVPELSRNMAGEMDQAMDKALGDSSVPKSIKDEIRKNRNSIQREYGRFYLDPLNPEMEMRTLSQKKKGKGGWLKWLGDDGLHTYVKIELSNLAKGFMLEDISREMVREPGKGSVKPLHGGADEMPTLSTPYRSFGELLNIEHWREKDPEGKDPLRPVLKWSLPLKHARTLSFAEFMNRISDAGSDVVGTSGTMARRLKNFFRDMLGFKLANEKNGTPSEHRTFMIAGSDGVRATDSKNPGMVRPEEGLFKLMTEMAGLSADGAYRDPQTLRLVGALTRRHLIEREAGKKHLVEIFVSSMEDLDRIEKMLRESPVFWDAAKEIYRPLTEDEFVRLYPGYVRRMTEEPELAKTSRKHNIESLDDGKAKVVLIVRGSGDRGTDFKYKAYEGDVTKITLYSDDSAIIEAIQGDARLGLGRIADRNRVLFIDVTSVDRLLSDTAGMTKTDWSKVGKDDGAYDRGYIPELLRAIKAAKEVKVLDASIIEGETVKRMSEIMEKLGYNDEARLKELMDIHSAEFKAFATNPEVYAAMHPLMQEYAQNMAIASSGVLQFKQQVLTKNGVMVFSTAIGLAITLPLVYGFGFGFMKAGIISGVASQITTYLGNKVRPRTTKELQQEFLKRHKKSAAAVQAQEEVSASEPETPPTPPSGWVN